VTQALDQLAEEVTSCRRCPRLVRWREWVAAERKPAFQDQSYWGRPVPGFGDPEASLVILGLAPAAHGANRTGRMFTGDRSGDFLCAAMWRAGLANIPTSIGRGDRLRLRGAWVTAAVRCAPPDNKPMSQERENCLPWTERELVLLRHARVLLCLGAFAWDAGLLLRKGIEEGSARARFKHGALSPGRALTLVGCYHPSQQNTFTRRLTEEMIDEVLAQAIELAVRPRA
jgi:uracil-DNA glycosylase family 4